MWRAGCISQDTYLLYVGIRMLVNIKMFYFTQVLGTKIVDISKEEGRREDYRLSVGFSFR